MNKTYVKIIGILVLALLIPGLMLAQTGKVRGIVTDKATGDPLPGANITIEGTTIGASADLNGVYVILAVPVGVFTVRANFIGYQAEVISNIRVSSNQTTTLDFGLNQSAIQVEALEIVAERPIIQRNTTNTVRLTTQEDIENLAIRGVDNIIALNAGVVMQNGVIYIRGGRADEVTYYIDGSSANDPYTRRNFVSIIQEAIEEIQMQAGGFTAEYGGANSGIVSTTFRSGGSQVRGSIDYRTDDFADPGSEFLGTTSRGYHNVVGTLGGPVPGISKMKFFVAGQYNYVENRSNIFIEPFKFDPLDSSLPEYTTELWNSGQREFYAPWFVEDALEGRTDQTGLPLVNAAGDTIPFEFKRNFLPNNQQKNYSTNMTLIYPVSNSLRLRLTGNYAFNRTPNGGWNNFFSAVNNYYDSRRNQNDNTNAMVALRATHLISPTTFYDVSISYSSLSGKGYDPLFGDDWQAQTDARQWAAAGLDTSQWQRTFTGPLPYSAILNYVFTSPNLPRNGFNKFERTGLGFQLDFTSQLNRSLEVKFGGRIDSWTARNWQINSRSYNNFVYGIDAQLWDETLPNNGGRTYEDHPILGSAEYRRTLEIDRQAGLFYYGWDLLGENKVDDGPYGARKPFLASTYFQTKWEYRDLILNIGIRYERYDYKALRPEIAELPVYDAANEWIDVDALVFTEPYDYVLPRLNFAFPVTANTVFYAQYGKYVQSLGFSGVYQSFQSLSNLIPERRNVIGTSVFYLQKPERNDQYELGIRQALTDNFAFTVTAFYKDMYDLVGDGTIYADGTLADEGGQQKGARFDGALVNNDIATAKGLELTLELRRTKRLSARVNYTLSNTRGTASSPRANSVANADVVVARFPTHIYNLNQNQAHRGSVLLDYRFGRGDGGAILQGLGTNILLTFNSGHNYTAVEEPANLGQATPWNVGVRMTRDRRFRFPVEPVNTSTTPWNFNIDLALDKMFYFDRFNIKLYSTVLNLLNTRNIINVYETSGTDDDDGWLKHPLASQYVAIDGYDAMYRATNLANGYGWYYATGTQLWGEPRQIRMGVSVEFR